MQEQPAKDTLVLRVFSPAGIIPRLPFRIGRSRLEIDKGATVGQLAYKVAEHFKLKPGAVALFRDPACKEKLAAPSTVPLGNAGIFDGMSLHISNKEAKIPLNVQPAPVEVEGKISDGVIQRP